MSKRIGLFVDVSNVYISLKQVYGRSCRMDFRKLLEFAKSQGEVAVSHAYCTVNPQMEEQARFPVCLKHIGFTDVNCRLYVVGEDGEAVKGFPDTNCDVEMAFDVGRSVWEHRLNTVILVTGDHQFADVARKLRNAGVEVWVIGPDRCTSPHLIVAASRFQHIAVAGLLRDDWGNGDEGNGTGANTTGTALLGDGGREAALGAIR